ncbi:MAG: CPBP family intramembrane glutamic endopeptidase [Planctomycetota bacterium]|nr:CPBP family intramembrane glutamic endopeptidase [Planctomycetota bacterium]
MNLSPGPRELFRKSLLFHGSMAIVSIIVIALLYPLVEFVRPMNRVLSGFGIGFGIGVVWASISVALPKIWSHARALETRLALIFEGLNAGEVLILAALSSFAEELLFRGLMQPFLGLWVTSILFGMAHWTGDRRLLAWPLISILAGFLLGKLSLWQPTGLSGAIGAHFAINWIGLSRLSRITKLPPDRFSEDE